MCSIRYWQSGIGGNHPISWRIEFIYGEVYAFEVLQNHIGWEGGLPCMIHWSPPSFSSIPIILSSNPDFFTLLLLQWYFVICRSHIVFSCLVYRFALQYVFSIGFNELCSWNYWPMRASHEKKLGSSSSSCGMIDLPTRRSHWYGSSKPFIQSTTSSNKRSVDKNKTAVVANKT